MEIKAATPLHTGCIQESMTKSLQHMASYKQKKRPHQPFAPYAKKTLQY